MGRKKVKKTLMIPESDFNSFKKRHPGHGDFVWFVREALRRYNELNEFDPKETVKIAVAEIDLKD